MAAQQVLGHWWADPVWWPAAERGCIFCPTKDSATQPIYVDFLNGPDIAALDMTDEDILGAIEASLATQGRKQAVIEPRMHLKPDLAVDGHFNVLRGAIGSDVQRAGVKVVSDFVYNYEQGLPSEMAILALFDPKTGKPQAILDAGGITDMRTRAVTAIGAKYLVRKDS